jgi:hypothetical protein
VLLRGHHAGRGKAEQGAQRGMSALLAAEPERLKRSGRRWGGADCAAARVVSGQEASGESLFRGSGSTSTDGTAGSMAVWMVWYQPACSMPLPLASGRLCRPRAPAGAVYRGPYTFAEAGATKERAPCCLPVTYPLGWYRIPPATGSPSYPCQIEKY